VGGLQSGGGTSAVAASAHAGCQRFRLTDPFLTRRTRKALAEELGHTDARAGIPEARWMRALTLPWFAAAGRRVHYWGDLDTHGFAILDQLRARVPTAESFLMDRETLLTHAEHWGREPAQHPGPLTRLMTDEAELYRDLLEGVHGHSVRLEQERIGFPYLERAVTTVLAAAPPR